MYSFDSEITAHIVRNLLNNVEKSFLQGIKDKGFEFNCKAELERFVNERCSCVDNIQIKQRVYYVDNIPFFLHNYKAEVITDPRRTGNPNMIIGSLGTFSYL